MNNTPFCSFVQVIFLQNLQQHGFHPPPPQLSLPYIIIIIIIIITAITNEQSKLGRCNLVKIDHELNKFCIK